jgi:hypothetical protein
MRHAVIRKTLLALTLAALYVAPVLADGTVGVHLVAQTQPLCILTGTVKTNSGSPIEGARLTLTGPTATSAPLFAQTDADGTYKFTVANSPVTFPYRIGMHTVQVRASGYVGGSNVVFMQQGTSNTGDCNQDQVLNVALTAAKPVATPPRPAQRQPLCIIEGSVQHGNQVVPVKGARVTLTGESATQVTQTDAHGAFRLTAPVGSYTIEVHASGYTNQRAEQIKLERPLAGNICLDYGIMLVPLSLAKQRADRASITSSPRSDPFQVTIQNAITAYCKNHPGLSCSLYQADALKCEGTAYGAVGIFPTVAMWKEQDGLSSNRTAQMMAQSGGDFAIALAAGEYLDHMHVTTRSYHSADIQKMALTFASAVVLPACLQNITR